MSTEPPKSLCAKCFKSVQIEKFVKCNVCNGKYHYICSEVSDNNALNAIKKVRNIVYNCRDCITASTDLVSTVSLLSTEIRELKNMISEFLNNARESENATKVLTAVTANTGLTTLPGINSHYQSSNSATKAQPSLVTHTNIVSTGDDNGVMALACNDNDDFVDAAADVPEMDVNYLSTNVRNIVAPIVSQSNDANVLPIDITNVSRVHTQTTMPLALSQSRNNLSKDAHGQDTRIVSQQLPTGNPINNAEWMHVKQKKRRIKRTIIGENDTNELQVIARKKWIHISSFKPSVTEQHILTYVGKKLDIGSNHLACYKLVKRDANVSELKSINFKLGISPQFYEDLFKPSLWPSSVKVRPFNFFLKDKTELVPV